MLAPDVQNPLGTARRGGKKRAVLALLTNHDFPIKTKIGRQSFKGGKGRLNQNHILEFYNGTDTFWFILR